MRLLSKTLIRGKTSKMKYSSIIGFRLVQGCCVTKITQLGAHTRRGVSVYAPGNVNTEELLIEIFVDASTTLIRSEPK